jgi:hypothetical protein
VTTTRGLLALKPAVAVARTGIALTIVSSPPTQVVKVGDNKLGELAAAAVAAAMRGTTKHGLVSLGVAHLDGPHCISGTLYGRKRPEMKPAVVGPSAAPVPAPTPAPGVETKPPAMPGLRLVHGAV